MVIIQYFLPLVIIAGAYIRMGAQLWRAQIPGNRDRTRDSVVLRKKIKVIEQLNAVNFPNINIKNSNTCLFLYYQVIKMLSLVVIMFGLCWFPLQTYNFLHPVFPSINSFEYINVLWFGGHWIAMSNSCVNPFIYAIYNEKFKHELRRRVRCLSENTQAASTSLSMQHSSREQIDAHSGRNSKEF